MPNESLDGKPLRPTHHRWQRKIIYLLSLFLITGALFVLPSAKASGIAVGTSPMGMALDSANGYIYVANYGSNDVSVIQQNSVVATVNVGTEPIGVTFDSSNSEVYVTNFGSNTVSVIQGTSVVTSISVGTRVRQGL